MTRMIVTGVDGSETAARAAQTAAMLAGALGAEVLVVCAYGKYEVERVQTGREEFVFSSEAAAQEVAAEAVKPLRAEYPELRITAKAEEGKPAEALVRVAEKAGADIIVVGNKRVQGLARVLGSIATDVAHKAPCDVYIAHTNSRP